MTEPRETARAEDVDAALQQLASELEYPPVPDLSEGVRQRLLRAQSPAGPSWTSLAAARSRLAGILLSLVVLAALVLGVWPAARQAIAERLGLPGIEIRVVATAEPYEATSTPQTRATPTPASTPTAVPTEEPAAPTPPLALGRRVTLEEAQRRVPFRILLPAALGPPDAVYLRETPPVPVVTLLYAPRPPELPPTSMTGIGLLIMEFQGTPGEPLFMKGVGPEGVIELVTVHHSPGYWITGGPHILIARTPGGEWQDESRLAGNTLLWASDSLTFRLEGEIAKETALLIAESMQ
jgi:hypothetical protein